MSVIISKESINRLLKDVKQIMKNPLTENGIYYIHDDTNMLKGYAMIVGPSDTPYFAGNYFFEIDYPASYPHNPPKVTYCTNGNNIRFNPNLYKCGKVCVSLLNTWKGEQWTSCQTISTVLLTLCTLLCENPLLNEPGVTKTHNDLTPYNEIIEYSNLDIAVCDILSKKKGVYLDFFTSFEPFIKENFIKNYDKIMLNASKKLDTIRKPTIFKTGFYTMNINVDYTKVVERIKEIKRLLDSEKEL
jgi:ubiquitin-conjugating enzyme E2 Z